MVEGNERRQISARGGGTKSPYRSPHLRVIDLATDVVRTSGKELGFAWKGEWNDQVDQNVIYD